MRYQLLICKFSAVTAAALFAAMAIAPAVASSSAPEAPSRWKALGARWAVELDAKGRALAIDDLSYPAWTRGAIIGRIEPGASREGSMRAATDEWNEIPLKAGMRASPIAFTLDDVDLSLATADASRFEALAARLEGESTPGLLKRFRFERDSEGGIRISIEPEGSSALSGSPSPRGLRVVRLDSLRANLWSVFVRKAQRKLINELLGLVTAPLLSALLNTALDRFFHFHDLLRDTRQEALAELLADPSPGFALSASERSLAGQAIMYAKTSFWKTPTWIWRRPLKEWNKRVASEKRGADKARDWLDHAGVEARVWSARFDWQPSSGVFFLSGAGMPWPKPADGPIVALDPRAPWAIFARRAAAEAKITAAVFAAGWVPFGSYAVKALKKLIQSPEDRDRRWEARLAARFAERERESGGTEGYSDPLALLSRQRVNPLELPRALELETIAARKRALGIAQ
jgi:hypothetical protein